MEIREFNIAWLPVHYECNNKCSWCYAPEKASSSHEKSLNDKKEDEFVGLLSGLNVKRAILIGGEPTLYQGLQRLIYKLSSKKISASLVTNGRRAQERDYVSSLKDSGLKSITFSIEGHNSDVHDRITQIRGSFNQAVKGLENSLYLGIPTATETTICNQNSSNLENIVEFLEKFNLSTKMFNICSPCLIDRSSYFSLSPTHGAKLFEKVYKKAIKKNVKLVTPVPVCAFNPETYKEMIKTKSVSHACHILFGSNFVLDPDGDVLPCVHFTGFPMFNVYDNKKIISPERFRDIYRNPEGVGEKFRHKLRRYPSEKCSLEGCWDPCTGGCSIFWFKYDPKKEINGKNKS